MLEDVQNITYYLTSSEDVSLMRVIECTLVDREEGKVRIETRENLHYNSDEIGLQEDIDCSSFWLEIVDPAFDWLHGVDVRIYVHSSLGKAKRGMLFLTRGTLFDSRERAQAFADKFYRLNEAYILKTFPQFKRKLVN